MVRSTFVRIGDPSRFRIRRTTGEVVDTIVLAKRVRPGARPGQHVVQDFLVQYQGRTVSVSELKREWGEASVELMDAARYAG